MSSARTRLIAAMHTACGCKVKSATEWLTAAQTFDALRAAFRAAYGKRLPTRQKLGQDLSEWAGKAYCELRLVSIYDSNKKASRYAVETAAESQLRETKEWNKAERQEIIDAEKEQRALRRALKAANEREAKEREAAELAAVAAAPTLTIAEAAHTPLPDFETTTRIADDGRIVREPVRGRDGEPIKKGGPTVSHGNPLAGCTLLGTRYTADKKIEEWQKPDGHIFENWVPLTPANGWHPAGLHGQPTRAQLGARHHQYEAPANKPSSAPALPLAGLPGPNGIRQDTSGAESWRNRLLLNDF